MLGIDQVRDAHPGLWESAAEGWRSFADKAVSASADIRDQGKAKVDEHWQDEVGQAAGAVLEGIAGEYDAASDLMRSVAMILSGLGEAVEVAQRELLGALEVARAHHLVVRGDGSCDPVDQPDSQGDNGFVEAMEWKPRVEAMLADAVEAANQADEVAAEHLRRLRDSVTVTDTEVALDQYQEAASRAQVELVHFALPHGQSREVVAAWWGALTDTQRAELERAVPVEVADLDGVPQDVKDRLRGPGPLDRVEVVRFALSNWDNAALDDPDPDVNDCTRFASRTLAAAGMPESSDWTGSSVFRLGGPTHSWAGAGELYEYLTTETKSHEVPITEARPGDLVFLRRGEESGHPEAGDIHHTAVVTSVTPDGVVHYTQHDDSKVNVSLQGRERAVEQGLGDQDYLVVRVDPGDR